MGQSTFAQLGGVQPVRPPPLDDQVAKPDEQSPETALEAEMTGHLAGMPH